MIKLFDYKFLITLGLSLVVYFLYREVEILNKRISEIEKNSVNNNKKLIDLPPPPVEDNIIEEYSNEENEQTNIYSHDNLETNSNEQDSLMVDSILNMAKPESEKSLKVLSDKTPTNDSNIKLPELNNDSHILSDDFDKNLQNKEKEEVISEDIIEEIVDLDDISSKHTDTDIDEVVLLNKISLDTLNKKKLDELQELASKNNIDINNQNGKKKKKSDLALEIFNKLSL